MMTTIDSGFPISSTREMELGGDGFGSYDELRDFALVVGYHGDFLNDFQFNRVEAGQYERSMDSIVAWDFGLHPYESVESWTLPPSERDSLQPNSDRNAPSLIEAQTRLERVNRHFRRKAGAVFNDDDAVRLLARLYADSVMEIAEFNFCEDGQSLAKLTAANFCEIGANGVYITDRGKQFIDTLNAA